MGFARMSDELNVRVIFLLWHGVEDCVQTADAEHALRIKLDERLQGPRQCIIRSGLSGCVSRSRSFFVSSATSQQPS